MPRRSHALAAAVVLLAVLALVIAAASGGGGDSGSTGIPGKQPAGLQPAAGGAPADAQIDRLEQIVRSARRRP